jgi:hypothetical protein
MSTLLEFNVPIVTIAAMIQGSKIETRIDKEFVLQAEYVPGTQPAIHFKVLRKYEWKFIPIKPANELEELIEFTDSIPLEQILKDLNNL